MRILFVISLLYQSSCTLNTKQTVYDHLPNDASQYCDDRNDWFNQPIGCH